MGSSTPFQCILSHATFKRKWQLVRTPQCLPAMHWDSSPVFSFWIQLRDSSLGTDCLYLCMTRVVTILASVELALHDLKSNGIFSLSYPIHGFKNELTWHVATADSLLIHYIFLSKIFSYLFSSSVDKRCEGLLESWTTVCSSSGSTAFFHIPEKSSRKSQAKHHMR